MVGRRVMTGFPTLLPIDNALDVLKQRLERRPLDQEVVRLEDAAGRVSAVDITAPRDAPDSDRSAVDGYAVLATEVTSASPTNPIEFRLVGSSEAGNLRNQVPRLGRGETVRVFTGGPIPHGSDAVVMAEFGRQVGSSVWIERAVHSGQNVSYRGEDFQQGATIVRGGTEIRAWHIGALASMNLSHVAVFRRLVVGILSTGNEILEGGSLFTAGGVVNSSKPMLSALVREAGGEFLDLGTVKDDLQQIVGKLREGLPRSDLLVTTGGTSLGEKDLVPEAVNNCGSPGVLVHGVGMRPGKPTGIGLVDGKAVFMLSGYPVAALVAFEVFVQPVIRWMYGSPEMPKPAIRGRLLRRVASPVGVRSFVRVKVTREGDDYIVEPLRLTGSGILSSMTRANGLLVIGEGVEGFDEGEEVNVTLIQPLEAAT